MRIITIALLFIMFSSFGQEFKTSLIFQKGTELDSVIIGFDNNATDDIDEQFSEYDLLNEAFDTTFEVRLVRINNEELDCEENNLLDKAHLFLHMSKIDITQGNCNSANNVARIFASIIVRNKDLPFTIKWNSSVFKNECLNGSFITDWHPGGWFDASCGQETLHRTSLTNQDSLIIEKPSGIYIIDTFSETLSMFHIGFVNSNYLNINKINGDIKISVYPNPTNRFLKVESGFIQIEKVDIYNIYGGLIISSNKSILDISSLIDGIYIILVTDINGNQISDKVIINKTK